jgi:hypothetical protein
VKIQKLLFSCEKLTALVQFCISAFFIFKSKLSRVYEGDEVDEVDGERVSSEKQHDAL